MRREWFDSHRRTSRCMIWLVVGLLSLAPTVASAQQKEGGEEAKSEKGSDDGRSVDKKTARKVLKLLRSGKKAYESEDYEGAYDDFSKAYRLWPRPAILVRLGKTAEELGQFEKAMEHYRAFLDEKPDSKMSSKIEEKIAGLEAEMKATVSIASTPEGATVRLGSGDGESIGETPLETMLEPGQTTIVVEFEGYESEQKSLELEAGTTSEVAVELEEIITPKETDSFSAGDARPEGESGSTEGAAAAGGTDSGLAAWGWTAAGVGVAGLAAGGTFSLLQSGVEEEVADYERGLVSSSRQELDEMKETARGHYRNSLIAYSAGGALTAVGAGILIHRAISKGGSEDSTDEKVKVNLDIGVGDGGGWAGLKTRF